jgi:hypothetical protein
LCSKGILELDMDSHPYFSYMFVLSKLVVPIVGPRQYNLSSSSCSKSHQRNAAQASRNNYFVPLRPVAGNKMDPPGESTRRKQYAPQRSNPATGKEKRTSRVGLSIDQA